MADITQVSPNAVAAAGNTYDAAYKLLNDKVTDARLAVEKAASAATQQLTTGNVVTQAAGAVLSILADLVAAAVGQITAVKQSASPGLHDLTVQLLADALLLDITSQDIPAANGGANAGDVNAKIGGKFLSALKGFMNADSQATPASAETAASALIGLCMQMSVNAGVLGLIGGAVPGGFHLDELKELNEMLEKSLGLGRMVRQFVMPYIKVCVQQPLTNSLNQKHRTALLAEAELARAVLRQPGNATWLSYLQQHGIPDDQIQELLFQRTVRLKAEEWDLLGALGIDRGDINNLQDAAEGMDAALLGNRLRYHQYKRLERANERALQAVLSEISGGFLDPTGLEKVFTDIGLPADEQQAWRVAAGYIYEHPRKRMSQGDMEFLFEAAQINQGDVLQWAAAEGYSTDDQQRLLLLFELKATAATAKSTGGAAAKAAGRHAEHIAYVTDEISGLWGRAPTAAELTYWVSLLDSNARTRSDVKAELKALPTTGPAIPAGV